jgi:hypothetical protein
VLDSTVFPNTPSDFFWTASPAKSKTAWQADFSEGGSFQNFDGEARVRCVR